MRIFSKHYIALKIVVLGFVLPLLGSALSVTILQGWRHHDELSHSLLEVVGGLIAFLTVGCIYYDKKKSLIEPQEIPWLGAAFISMGFLDLIHALVPLDNNFVWFHSLATFTGGFFFAGVLLFRRDINVLKFLPLVVLAATAMLIYFSLAYPEFAPRMLSPEGTFSLFARFLNIGGGLGFIAASVYFYRKDAGNETDQYALLSAHCLLFGMAGCLFEFSQLWDAAWWWWHVLRILAYVILICFFFDRIKMAFLLLRTRIALMTLTVSVVTATLISMLAYYHIYKVTEETAIEGLAGETRLMALEFKGAYDEMRNDGGVVVRTPPFRGLYRSMKNNDIDPLDGSTTELWRKRLETIFISMMKYRPHYTQMRFIGMADHGRELVRVNQVGKGEFERVPPAKLQQKFMEPYFQRGTSLQPDHFYFSEVTFNREHGKKDGTHTPTKRLVVPIFFDDQMFGMLVINANYEQLLKRQYDVVKPSKHMFVVNQSGHYMEYIPGQGTLPLEMKGEYTRDPHILITKILGTKISENTYVDDKEISYLTRIITNPGDQGAFLGVILKVPKNKLFANAYAARREVVIASSFLILITLCLTYIISSWFTRPLQKMTETVSGAVGNPNALLVLPVGRHDELGELARAFDALTAALAESEARARGIIENVYDTIITINEQSEIETFNPAGERVFGYKAAEVLGKNVKLMMPEPYHGEHDQYVANYLDTGERKIIGVGREVVARRKDGSTFPMELSVSEVRFADRRIFTAIIRDITDRKRKEREKETLIRQLEVSNRELDNFAYIASHDLKAPLRVIDNASRWLEEDLEKFLDEDTRESMDLLRSRVARMEKLLDDLLSYSRIGRTSDDRFEEEVNGERILNNIRELLAPPEGFSINGDSELANIKVNRMPLQQIILNLVSNAIKHHDKDKGRIDVSVSDAGEFYQFTVKDDGPGIAEEFHEQVFNMFKTLKPRDEVEGSGMGLAMVLKNIKIYGGDIELKSEEGKGCAFIFTWPKDQQIIEAIT